MPVTKQHIIKKELIEKLVCEHAFWSYDTASISIDEMSDDLVIEKVLLHLDIDDVNLLFTIYPEKKIKKVWRDRLCPLEPYYHDLNKLYAVAYFHIKNPVRYLKMESARHLKSLT
jgi:hypothetical protein